MVAEHNAAASGCSAELLSKGSGPQGGLVILLI